MTEVLNRYWLNAQQGFAVRPGRERWLFLVVAFAVSVAVGDRAMLHPMEARVSTLQMREQALDSAPGGDGAVKRAEDALSRRRRELAQELSQVDIALSELDKQLVAPTQMRQLVESVISALPGMRLVQMQNQPPEPLRNVDDGHPQKVQGQVYRHGFRLVVEGGYSDLVQYLERLENGPQRLFWKHVELDASGYPRVRMTIEVYTLSREPSWLVL
jgi:MSHA biogenesis protein MshJ